MAGGCCWGRCVPLHLGSKSAVPLYVVAQHTTYNNVNCQDVGQDGVKSSQCSVACHQIDDVTNTASVCAGLLPLALGVLMCPMLHCLFGRQHGLLRLLLCTDMCLVGFMMPACVSMYSGCYQGIWRKTA